MAECAGLRIRPPHGLSKNAAANTMRATTAITESATMSSRKRRCIVAPSVTGSACAFDRENRACPTAWHLPLRAGDIYE